MKLMITSLLWVMMSVMPMHVFSHNGKITKVTYNRLSNGKKVEGSDITMKYASGIVYLSSQDAKMRYYMDYNRKRNVSIMKDGEHLYKTEVAFDSLPQPRFGDKSEKILGYKCKYAVFSAFSNKIEVWYTKKAKIKGSPYRNYIPTPDALVLKVVVNGNRTIVASDIEVLKDKVVPDYPVAEAKGITGPEFEELRIKSRYTTVEVFNNEKINFEPGLKPASLDNAKGNTTFRMSKGTVILKKVKLPSMVRKGAYTFVKLTCNSMGDAYDRTGSVFMIPTSGGKSLSMLDALEKGLDKVPAFEDNLGQKYQGIVSDNGYDAPVELMRFFTPFGVGHFNNLRVINNYPWKKNVEYKQEVSSLIPNDSDEIWVGVFIGNYDGGGHQVSLELDFYPGYEKEEASVNYIQPLFSTVNIMEMSGQNYGRLFKNDTLKMQFDIPENVKNMNLLYTSTGHGGWGTGDEFVPKMNQLILDGKPLFKMVPWRTDCGTHRFSNPASGNFENGLSSSDLSRSNWCPGTLTPPYVIPLESIKSGKHLLQVVIDQGQNEGNSFSHWSVSGVIIGDKTK